MTDGNSKLAGIKITHHRPHCQYVDISLTEKVDNIIKTMIDMPASKASFYKIFYIPNLTQNHTLRLGILSLHKKSRVN